jgi:uncharacterized protein (DUF305 family)
MPRRATVEGIMRTSASIACLVLALAGAATTAAAQAHTPAPGRISPAARAAADSGRPPYTRADVHFMTGMIAHHAQAIVMAGWAPTHGAGSSVRALCERIVVSQQDEITTMQRWLRDRREAVPEATGAAHSMPGMDHGLMPGMLTAAQMTQLDAARGAEFDRLFLTFMIQHHNGAIRMVEELFAARGAAQDDDVFKMASDINVDQITEIDRMTLMLNAMRSTRREP